MTPERADYILRHKLIGGDLRFAFHPSAHSGRIYADGITPGEHDFVMSVWRGMPSWTSYYDAVCRVARGEAPEPPAGPGYPGPCPDGMDWSEWLARNNVD